mgnify:CR=1 FL=1
MSEWVFYCVCYPSVRVEFCHLEGGRHDLDSGFDEVKLLGLND